jgi:putative ABC transport system substrate-binding protein
MWKSNEAAVVFNAMRCGTAAPVRLAAQRTRKARLGVLSDDGRSPVYNAMFNRLGELGWVEHRNMEIVFLTLDPNLKQSAAKVQELVRLKCDVVFAVGTPAAMSVKTHAPNLPMVFSIGGDPVGLGLVASLARPGGAATGYMQGSQEIVLKQLSLLREMVPSAKRVAVLFEAGNPSMLQGVRSLQHSAAAVGLETQAMSLRDWKDVDAAEKRMMREAVDGMIVMYDRITSGNAWNIASLADRRGLPAVFGNRHFIANGGALVSYGIDWPAQIVRSADYLARILDGAKPADLPVLQPAQFELVVNLWKARRLGQTIPQSVLLQATEVID